MNILLGLTGSVATVLCPKLIEGLLKLEDAKIRIIVTEKAWTFIESVMPYPNVEWYQDKHEWYWGEHQRSVWRKDDKVLHVELAKWADVFVVAPITANTMAKFAHGLCDNLLTSTYLALPKYTKRLIAPAMNTQMWLSDPVQANLKALTSKQHMSVVMPVKKTLACGDTGVGALAEVSTVCKAVEDLVTPAFPLSPERCNGIPVKKHPGAFGVQRRFSFHTGVDLYTLDDSGVYLIEDAVYVGREHFTGPQDNSPWWNNTEAMLFEGKSGVICYGELQGVDYFTRGQCYPKGTCIGRVTPVLPPEKARPDIEGHSCSMLHVELYPHGATTCSTSWKLGTNKVDTLLDPTPLLLQAAKGKFKLLTNEKS